MEKYFTLNNIEYTVRPCTAIADCDETNTRQNALFVSYTAECGEIVEHVVFGWKFEWLENAEDFEKMCEDSYAWESYYEVLATVEVC